LTKKTKYSEELPYNPNKRPREEGKPIINNNMPLNNINVNPKKMATSLDSLSNQNKINNFNQNVIGNVYNEQRLSAMSHIMILKPKHKNYVVPVLPGQFIKY
jgi:hypothetical protein